MILSAVLTSEITRVLEQESIQESIALSGLRPRGKAFTSTDRLPLSPDLDTDSHKPRGKPCLAAIAELERNARLNSSS